MEENLSRRMAKFKVSLKSAIKSYLLITKPLHKLADKKIELLTEILYLYTVNQKRFTREEDIWRFVFSGENRALVRNNLNMGKQVFENYLTELRNKKIIINNQVAPSFNPSIKPDCNVYEMIFKFEIIDGQ